MGRRDPIYDVPTKALVCRLINQDGLGPTAASKRLLELTGVQMPPESARKYAEKERRDTLPPLDEDNAASEIGSRLLALANAELHALEVIKRPGTIDLDRATKIARLTSDAHKLRNTGTPTSETQPASPLAQLETSDGQGTGQAATPVRLHPHAA